MRYLLAVPLLAGCMFHPSEEAPDAYVHGQPPQSDATKPPPDPPPGARRVFVSQGVYSGALTGYVTAADGLAAGDKICDLRAKAAGLGGTWVAWLSSSTADAIDRVTGVGPWKMNGQIAFMNRAGLYGEPLVPLAFDERGHRIDPAGGEVAVWTGTKAGGQRHTETCGNWSSTTLTGRMGVASTTFDWTDVAWRYCSAEQHLICFEL